MNTPQEKLNKYMETKVKMLYEATNDELFFDLYADEDRADLMEWSDEDAESTITSMVETSIHRHFDGTLCPWCL